jgi:hypothetical protein
MSISQWILPNLPILNHVDFYSTQIKRMSVSDIDPFDDNSEDEEFNFKAKQNRRVSVDLNEAPQLYTARPTITTNLIEKENHENVAHENSDDDRSNNGQFEFPESSRKRYESRSSDCDSSLDLSSFIDETNTLTESWTQPAAPVTLNQISMKFPMPVCKRLSDKSVGSSGVDSAQDEIERTNVTEALEQVSSNESNSQPKAWPLRFSWTTSTTEPKTRCIDELERTSATLNDAALPSRKRPSWNIWLANNKTRHSFKEEDQHEKLAEAQASENASNICAAESAPNMPEASDAIIKEPSVFIDPSLFGEIRGTKSNHEFGGESEVGKTGEEDDESIHDTKPTHGFGDQIEFGKTGEEDDEDEIEFGGEEDFYDEYIQMMLRASTIESQDDPPEPLSNSVEIPTFNEHTERNTSQTNDDASTCTNGTNESDAAVVLIDQV